MRRLVSSSPHVVPVLILVALCLLYWGKVLFTGQVLLPGAMLGGFAPFGADPNAPWNILQWDALAQYYPWRVFAARQLHSGLLPLWNPHQFAGAPFIANGQSAVFYPLNLPFWLLDPAYAFGVAAALHTLLTSLATYFLAQRWRLSRAASLLAAIAFAFCGYLAAWAMLPTLADTASWLPLLVLLLERAAVPDLNIECWTLGVGRSKLATSNAQRSTSIVQLPLALACALLAGHPQIFFYLLVALGLRALTLPRPVRALGVLLGAGVLCGALSALQLLPTLELARLGHRAAQGGASAEGWEFVRDHALQGPELLSLTIPGWPMLWGTLNESFGYVGFGIVALALAGIVGLTRRLTASRTFDLLPLYPALLATFGLLYALGTPLARVFYFHVPGLAQMGGVGRALVLWSFGAALLAGIGLDALRQRIKSDIVPLVALLIVTVELLAAGWMLHPIAPRASIYPRTAVTDWLQEHTRDGSRVLFITPPESWLPTEALQPGVRHPSGILPPNGAMVYGLFDVNGYDSLAPLAYRQFVAHSEGRDVAPPLNGNMILLQNPSPALDALGVRYIVTRIVGEGGSGGPTSDAENVWQSHDCIIWKLGQRSANSVPRRDGRDFSPGWRDGQYQPESFRLGIFVSLCALGLLAMLAIRRLSSQRPA